MPVDVNENEIYLKFWYAYAQLISCYYRLENTVNIVTSLLVAVTPFVFFLKEK